jgi:hypothetical protein
MNQPLVAAVVVGTLLSARAVFVATEPIFVATVDPSGVLVPIGIYHNNEWWRTWPAEDDPEFADGTAAPTSAPANFTQLPKDWLPPRVKIPSRWDVLFANGQRAAARATRPALAEGFSGNGIGIGTDLRTVPKNADLVHPGFAVAGPALIEPFAHVSEAEGRTILPAVHARVAETEAVAEARAREEKSIAYTVSSAERQAGNISIEGFVRTRDPVRNWMWYHLVGEKRYRDAPHAPPGDVPLTRIEVLFRRHADGQLEFVQVHAQLIDTSMVYMSVHPSAIVNIGGSTIWIVRHQYEDGVDYALVMPTMSGLNHVDWRERSGGNVFPFASTPGIHDGFATSRR